MIFLWGLLEDDSFRSVHDWLTRWGADVAFANHAAIGRTAVAFRSHPRPAYRFSCEGRAYPLSEMSAAYLRPYDHRDYAERGSEPGTQVSRADLAHQLVHDWAEHTPALVINRPSACAGNHSKPDQATDIRASGFLVPDSLITNDPVAIRDFAARHRSVIYKSMSSVRSIVKEFDVSTLDAVGRIGPAFFQRRIVGDNIRVHVVADEAMACRIESQSIDYRYGRFAVEPFDLPQEIAVRCIRLSRDLRLVLAGIDLIVTPAGEYYCLEVNPNPAFSYFDLPDEKGIARAVAQALLMNRVV
jgi:glutathione synthase/RimK-type ligase-like ATP-grasp enzyme